jgi:hypothetical protein
VTEPIEPTEPEPEPPPPKASLTWRLVRSVFAPDVLEDGGHDAPLSPRGRLLFRGVLVIGIVVLLVVTVAQK